MEERIIYLKKDDKVLVECTSDIRTCDERIITNTTFQYDEKSRERYKVLWCGDIGFDSRTGKSVTPPWEYSLISL